jgi:REP element-mobilizing transposase RayT
VSFSELPFKLEKQFRLKNWDYSSSGFYFVTICTKDRSKILWNPTFNFHVGTDHRVRSSIKDKIVLSNNNDTLFYLSDFGKLCHRIWSKIPKKFKNVILDDFIVMPDHLHGIIFIKHNYYQERTRWSVPTKFGNVGLLGEIIRWFKTMTTNEYIKNVKQNNWPKFNKQIGNHVFMTVLFAPKKNLYQKTIY